MKRIIQVILIVLVSIVISFGQAPQAIKYQAIARDNAGNPIVNQDIGLRISLLKGSTDGTVVYCETQNLSTNSLWTDQFRDRKRQGLIRHVYCY
jgi:hypothetical protein